MFIAMNRFRVARGKEAAFEEMWTSRESHLQGVPGFVVFHLLKGPAQEDHTLFASHTMWADEEAFRAWTRSEAFRKAHAGARPSTDLYIGPPQLEFFTAVQEIAATAT